MGTLQVKYDVLQVTMNYEINTALDGRGIGGSEYHTNNILNSIRDCKHRILLTLEIQLNSTGVSEDNSTSISIRNEDNELEGIFEGISTDEITNGRRIQYAFTALVRQRTSCIHTLLLPSRQL